MVTKARMKQLLYINKKLRVLQNSLLIAKCYQMVCSTAGINLNSWLDNFWYISHLGSISEAVWNELSENKKK